MLKCFLAISVCLASISPTYATDSVPLDDRYLLLMPQDLVFEVDESAARIPGKSLTAYPYVVDVMLRDDVMSLSEDTLSIDVVVFNPTGTSFSGAEIGVELREPGSGHVELLPTITATLVASDTTYVAVTWIPPSNLVGLQYRVLANVRLPFAKAGTECSNEIENGTFDSSIGGWALVNNLPPALGAKWSFGQLEVYSSTYNTVDQRAAQASQVQEFGGRDIADWTLQYRTRMVANDGIYGYGVAYTYVIFLGEPVNNRYPSLGGYVQWASTVSAPSNVPHWFYDRTQESVWHSFQLDLGDMLLALDLSDAYGIAVGAVAMPYCPLGYCNPSSSAFLDDVALVTCAETGSAYQGALVVTDLGQGLIGDRAAILQECFGGETTLVDRVVDLIPLTSAYTMWEDVLSYGCAAGVYEDSGDDFRAAFSALSAYFAMVEPTMDLMGIMSGLDGGSLLELDPEAIVHGVYGALVEASAIVARSGLYDGAKSIADLVGDVAAVLDERPATYRLYALFEGPLAVAVDVGGVETDESKIRHRGVLVTNWPDSVHTVVAVNDTVRVLADSVPLTGSAPATVRAAVVADGTAVLGLIHRDAAGMARQVRFGDLAVNAGDELVIVISDSTEVFILSVDRGGDGIVDETVTGVVQGQSEVPAEGVPGNRVIGRLTVEPNPFNPRTKITVEHAAGVDLDVSVVDIRGRLVKTVHRGLTGSNESTWVWDGYSDDGRSAASGIYFIHVRAANERIVQKATLVR